MSVVIHLDVCAKQTAWNITNILTMKGANKNKKYDTFPIMEDKGLLVSRYLKYKFTQIFSHYLLPHAEGDSGEVL